MRRPDKHRRVRFFGSLRDNFDLRGGLRVGCIHNPRVHVFCFHLGQHLPDVFRQNNLGIHRVVDSQVGEYFLRALPRRHRSRFTKRDLLHVCMSEILKRRYSAEESVGTLSTASFRGRSFRVPSSNSPLASSASICLGAADRKTSTGAPCSICTSSHHPNSPDTLASQLPYLLPERSSESLS